MEHRVIKKMGVDVKNELLSEFGGSNKVVLVDANLENYRLAEATDDKEIPGWDELQTVEALGDGLTHEQLAGLPDDAAPAVLYARILRELIRLDD